MKRSLVALSLLAASAMLAPAAHADEGLKWMTGCWRTADKSYKEVWSKPESGFLFGYALTYDETGALSFFEQARIDGGAPAVFNAYPGGFGPSEFTEESRGKNTVTFANNMQVAELSAGMGIFRTAMVTDNKAKAMDYHLSLMSKKMVAHMVPRDLLVFNKDSGIPTIIFTNEVDTIAGYPCKRAIAVFSKIDQPEIDLWYTDRIDMQNPNWFGPFADVPGVLLRYDVVQYGMRMRLDAISVQPGKVDPTKFDVKEDHDAVAPDVLHHELAEVLGTFSM